MTLLSDISDLLTLTSNQQAQIDQLKTYVSGLQGLTGSMLAKDTQLTGQVAALQTATGSILSSIGTINATDTAQAATLGSLSSALTANTAVDVAQTTSFNTLSSSFSSNVVLDSAQQWQIDLSLAAAEIKVVLNTLPSLLEAAIGTQGQDLYTVMFSDPNTLFYLGQSAQFFTPSQAVNDYLRAALLSHGFTSTQADMWINFDDTFVGRWPTRLVPLVVPNGKFAVGIWDTAKAPA